MPRRKIQSRTPDLSGYSISELSQLIRDAERQRERLRRQNVGEARRKIMSDLKEIGLSVADLFPGVHRNSNAGTTTNTQKRGRGRPRIKPVNDGPVVQRGVEYRNPNDPSQRWSGWGKRPGWFHEALASGKTPEDMAGRRRKA